MNLNRKEKFLLVVLITAFLACCLNYFLVLPDLPQDQRADATQIALFALLSMIAFLRIYKRKHLGKPIFELKQRRFLKVPVASILLIGIWAVYVVLLLSRQIDTVFASLVMVGVFSFWIYDHLSGHWAKVGIFEKGIASHESAWTYDEIKSWERHEHTGDLVFNVKKRLFVSNWVAFVVDKKQMKTLEPIVEKNVKKN